MGGASDLFGRGLLICGAGDLFVQSDIVFEQYRGDSAVNLAKVIVKMPVELYDQIYRRTLGVKGGMSGYLRTLAERDMAQEAPPIVPEVEREKERI